MIALAETDLSAWYTADDGWLKPQKWRQRCEAVSSIQIILLSLHKHEKGRPRWPLPLRHLRRLRGPNNALNISRNV